MDDFELRERMAAAKAESLERISQIDADVMPHVIAAELRGYPLGDFQPPKPKPEPVAPVQRRMTDAVSARLMAEIDRRIAAGIAAAAAERTLLDEAMTKAIGQVVGAERARHRKLIEALELRIDGLANAESKRQTITDAGVVDLPQFLGRRHG